MRGMHESELKSRIESAFEDRKLLENAETKAAVEEVIQLLDTGKLRVASRCEDG